MDGGYKYNEYIVTDSRHGGPPAWRLGKATIPYHKKQSYHGMFHRALNLEVLLLRVVSGGKLL